MASTTTEWILELVDRITGPMRAATETAGRMTDTVRETTETVEGLGRQAQEAGSRLEQFGKGMFFLNEAKEGIDTVASSFSDAIDPGVRFQYAMAQVQAISGVSGETLDMISGKARNLAKTFGTDAAEGTGAFSNILSQLGPELAKYPDVLGSMAQNAMTLSKTMDGDVNGAVSALTASFNSFTPPVNDAAESARIMTEQMNIIAKSAQVGAAEVPDIVAALKNIGPSAKNANVSFAETNAVLQVLGQNQIKAAEAGTALRNAMIILSAPSSDAAKALSEAGVDMNRMADRSIPLADRLEALKPVMNDTALMSRLFGRENFVAGQILVGNTGQITEWTKEVQNSTSATDQAAIIMDTYAEKQKRMQSWMDDLKISFFDATEAVAPFISVVGSAMSTVTTLGITVFAATQVMSLPWKTAWLGMTRIVTVAARSISTAIYSIPIVGWIALAVSALIGLGAWLYSTNEKVHAFFWGVGNLISAFVKGAVQTFKALFDVVTVVLNPENWFQPGKVKGAFEDFRTYVTAIGERVGSAYGEGVRKGTEHFRRSHTEKAGAEEKSLELSTGQVNKPEDLKLVRDQNGQSGENGSGSSGGGSRSSVGLGGSGGSGNVRNITMNITMNNSFSVSGDRDVREVAERVKRELIAIFSDVTPAVG